MRRRMFSVALLKGAVKYDLTWPKASAVCPSIRKHLDEWNPKTDKAGRLPNTHRALNIVKKSYKAAHRLGLVRFKHDIVVDDLSRNTFTSWQANILGVKRNT